MADGAQGDGHADDTKLHGKPDKTLRFSLCSDNLEGISEGQSAVWWHIKPMHNRKHISAMVFFNIFKVISENQESEKMVLGEEHHYSACFVVLSQTQLYGQKQTKEDGVAHFYTPICICKGYKVITGLWAYS